MSIRELTATDTPFGGCAPSRSTRVPYSLEAPKDEEAAGKYGAGPIESIPFSETGLQEALVEAGVNPIDRAQVWLRFMRLTGRTEEAAAARADADARMRSHNARAALRNAAVERDLAELTGLSHEALRKHLDRCDVLELAHFEAVIACAEVAADAGLAFDPEHPVPVLPPTELVTAVEGLAARHQLHHNPAESKHFLSPIGHGIVSTLVGSIAGVSAAGGAGLVHLSNIPREPVQAVLASGLGIAVTVVSGNAVKNFWREASERRDLGLQWFGSGLVAAMLTTVVMAIDVAVDQFGLVARSKVLSSVPGLSHHSASSSMDLVFYLVAAFVSVGYLAAAAIRGWRHDRAAARNRVVLAQEEERLTRIKEITDRLPWGAALAAGNKVVALEDAAHRAEVVYGQKLEAICERETRVRERLVQFREFPTSVDIAVCEKADIEAQGQQVEFDRLIAAIRDGERYVPQVRSNRKTGRSFWKRLMNFLGKPFARRGGR